MRRGWRPLLVGGAVVVCTFALAQAEIFAPSSPAGGTETGDVSAAKPSFNASARAVTDREARAAASARASSAGIDAATATAIVQQGSGVMPAGLVSGRDEADVVAYVVSISMP